MNPSRLFRQGLQDHDAGVGVDKAADMAFPDPREVALCRSEAQLNRLEGTAIEDWIKGWNYAERLNPLEDPKP